MCARGKVCMLSVCSMAQLVFAARCCVWCVLRVGGWVGVQQSHAGTVHMQRHVLKQACCVCKFVELHLSFVLCPANPWHVASCFLFCHSCMFAAHSCCTCTVALHIQGRVLASPFGAWACSAWRPLHLQDMCCCTCRTRSTVVLQHMQYSSAAASSAHATLGRLCWRLCWPTKSTACKHGTYSVLTVAGCRVCITQCMVPHVGLVFVSACVALL
jgi:hypothetical protein